MKRAIIYIIALSVLSACGPTWTRPNTTEQTYYQDYNECLMQGSIIKGNIPGVVGSAGGIAGKNRCMLGKGYTAQ